MPAIDIDQAREQIKQRVMERGMRLGADFSSLRVGDVDGIRRVWEAARQQDVTAPQSSDEAATVLTGLVGKLVNMRIRYPSSKYSAVHDTGIPMHYDSERKALVVASYCDTHDHKPTYIAYNQNSPTGFSIIENPQIGYENNVALSVENLTSS